MAFDSLRAYIDVLRAKDLVVDIRDADWDKEIGAITEVVALSRRPRTLMFDAVKGYPAGRRVVTNLYTSPRLQAIALGLPDDVPGVQVVAAWRELSKSHTKRPPRVVTDGPVRENVQRGDDVNLMGFPTPLWHEFDGGRYFGTGC